ncbi:hypothetical protein [Gracilibacillus sp. JCM 18860]|uniref:hypothetical protein n=1 Tax=Gracilibacillus sp. JCM 18860 TaxID=1306159 RepID=UPI000B2CED7D
MEKSIREEKLKRLEFFIGKWEIEVVHPHFQANQFMDKQYLIGLNKRILSFSELI